MPSLWQNVSLKTMTSNRKKPSESGGNASPGQPPNGGRELGYFKLVETGDGEFDWTPKDNSFDPPVGQDKLSEKVRKL
jgi:hypothetical protein